MFLYNQGGPLFSALDNGHCQIVEYLFSEGAVFYLRLAEQASRNRDIPMLETLLRYGWNINVQRSALTPPILP